MQELIKIEAAIINGTDHQTVNARDLHAFLEVKTDFRHWINRRIADYGFIENVDYAKIAEESSRSNLTGGQGQVDYFISIPMAKELAMVERNAKGKQARLYFIECERVAKEKEVFGGFHIPKTLPDALRLAANLADKNEQLEKQIEEDRPQVAFAKGIQATAKEETITGAAKILGIKPKAFFDWLRLSGFIYKQSAQATAKSIDAGLMVVRFAAIQHEDDVEKKAYAHVTGKGLYYFYTKLKTIGLISRNENLELAV